MDDTLFKKKAVILYGARQTGKTTLVKHLLSRHGGTYLNADEPDIRTKLSNRSSTALRQLFGAARLLVIDEAQRVENIGLTIKLIVDTYPDLQVIATGSSSFELADQMKEPLTGRKFEYFLHPISLQELERYQGATETDRLLNKSLIYGLYPEPVLSGEEDARARLLELSGSYLFKDILKVGLIRNPDGLEKLTRALALQISREVSFAEIGQLTGMDRKTVDTYIRILEKAFVIFRLPPYLGNRRNELKKMVKVYFWDTGIRNAVINNFAPPEMRSDAGALWENFFIAERIKHLKNNQSSRTSHFWRTYQQQEVDYLEDCPGDLLAAEIKTSTGRGRISRAFKDAYPQANSFLISPENWRDLIFAPV
ncbi:MAG TPA: ATP-binding protein [Kiritimatiellia bacterium]|nr:ATP-binding protein [Kiritimatiellia bacterium]HMO98153.1 ATP-binding protein [Kiritimatiellia bacterium]HMP96666.1 ATP-binding protein [Kiritimatiellia bacterium]